MLPPSQFSFWRNDLMRSRQMRRKGPWGKEEGREREGGKKGGLCCPGLGRPPHFLSKGVHKLPAAVLGKLHFNRGSSPEAIILLSNQLCPCPAASASLRRLCQVLSAAGRHGTSLPAGPAEDGHSSQESLRPSLFKHLPWELPTELLESVTSWSWELLSSTPSP